MLIDSHCHLDLLRGDPVEALRRARAAGVGGVVSIGTGIAQSARLRDLVDRLTREARPDLPRIWWTPGVHPDHADEGIPTPEALLALLDHPRAIGLGETGLDYFRGDGAKQAQMASFRVHIAAARAAGMPVAIHARAADGDVAAILEEEHARGPFAFLLHCFSSGEELARRALALGGYLSFSGIAAFPRSAALRAVARAAPPERILVETDAPYLAPPPHRGQPNEPAHVRHTAACLAETFGLTEAAFAARTTENFRRLYPKAANSDAVA